MTDLVRVGIGAGIGTGRGMVIGIGTQAQEASGARPRGQINSVPHSRSLPLTPAHSRSLPLTPAHRMLLQSAHTCHLYIGEAVLVGEGEGVAETLGLPLTLADPDRDTLLVSERELELV